MAVTENVGGSQSATIGTEQTLATVTTAGIYVLRVDVANLAANDIVELRIYTKARNATDTERLIHGPATYGPIPPDQKLADSVPIMATGDFRATLKQTAGTGRAFPWVILSSGA
ncbi:MAG: hypothetical protein ACREQ5_38725 [Candidatus Dormibacteria bacterium]